MSHKLLSTCIVILFSFGLRAQQPVQFARQSGWQTHYFRISSDTAEKYLRQSKLSPEALLSQPPFAIFHTDSVDQESLSTGNYVWVKTIGTELLAGFYSRSQLQVFALNNGYRVQLEVRDQNGTLVTNPSVWVNGKQLSSKDGKTIELPFKKPNDALIKVAIPGDTLLMQLTANEDVQRSAWQQWWNRFARSRGGYYITWPVRAVRTMIKKPPRYWFRKRNRSKNSQNGYMIFNKPKYLPGDTVKFKAYVLDKKAKPVKSPLDLYISYRAKSGYQYKKLTTLKPVTPSAFVYEWKPGDSLETDRNYTLELKDKRGRVLISDFFKLEDYLLDDVATYSLRAEKESYYKQDTLHFYTSAKDANGLALMDGRVSLYVLTQQIDRFHPDREFVPDTLYKEDKPLQVDGETSFHIPSAGFPAADLQLRVLAVFRNSNNETQEQSRTIQFFTTSRRIVISQEGRSLQAQLMENGKPVSAEGWMKEEGRKETRIRFPYTQSIHPYSQRFAFFTKNDTGKVEEYELFSVNEQTGVRYIPVQSGDTSGFILQNPLQISIRYFVTDGDRIIAQGGDSTQQIRWQAQMPLRKQYRVQWTYVWAGREVKRSETLSLADKLMSTSIEGAASVYPGQTDTLTIRIQDYKERPAAGVNLTAVSYNNQFKSDIQVEDPPYLAKYRNRRRIVFDNYTIEDASLKKTYSLGTYKDWLQKLNADTMLYYQLLFPRDSMAVAAQPVQENGAQLAIHVVKQGVPQEIYMLYLNREFAYWNGATDQSVYSFPVWPGYTQVGIRLRDRYVQIDSIYLQPHYKYDLVFDLDKLPAHARVEDRPVYYTWNERLDLNKQIWELQSDYYGGQAYVWQDQKLVELKNNTWHRVGPFKNMDSLQYFKRHAFDLKFLFESGYYYRLSPKMARLERRTVFSESPKAKIILPLNRNPKWILGDTLVPPPVIAYPAVPKRPYFRATNTGYSRNYPAGKGSLLLRLPKDSAYSYLVIHSTEYDTVFHIKSYDFVHFYGIDSGSYKIILVTPSFRYLATESVIIKGNGTTCLDLSTYAFSDRNAFAEKLADFYKAEAEREWEKRKKEASGNITTGVGLTPPSGNGIIAGTVTDEKGGMPVQGAMVMLKGYNRAALVNRDGSFSINGIGAGNFTMLVSCVGYTTFEQSVYVSGTGLVNILVKMKPADSRLNEVVVTAAYGVSRRKMGFANYTINRELRTSKNNPLAYEEFGNTDVTGSIKRGEEVAHYRGNNFSADSVVIRVRGVNSLSGGLKPLYVIDGVVMEELPEGFDLKNAQVDILKDAAATAIYGSRAAGGVLIINSGGFMPKSLRDQFRDYAFWHPNFFTDEKGEAKIAVTYPDNITSWQTFVVGMDQKRRITKASFVTKSFKPLLAQIALPQFLIEGDSAAFVGKIFNYTTNPVSLQTNLRVNDIEKYTGEKQAPANGSVTEELAFSPQTTDTLRVQYSLKAATGFADGEMKKIPVLRKGTEEARGDFWILTNDTSFTFTPEANAGQVIVHAQNNTLDVLLDELKQLKEYPYFCMEQTASKLTGLLLEKEIRLQLKQDFKSDKEIQKLLKKLQESQLYEGGWSWWSGGKANTTVTNYVVQALLPLRKDPLVESSVRNGLLFLQNNLYNLRRSDLLSNLVTMSEAGHAMDYTFWLKKLPFDSLTLHQQWQYVKIRQQQKLDYEKELQILLNKKTETMLGGLHWGVDVFDWSNNEMATTALAYTVLDKMEDQQKLLPSIVQYFLERRKEGRWRNTVESARTVQTILPFILKRQSDFMQPATVTLNREPAFTKFPFTYVVPDASQPVQFSKSGGGLVYLTAWQKIFNPAPQPVNDKFVIKTSFERTGNTIAALKAGEKAVMKVQVKMLKDAEYVQIEIPIPAGCTYAEKKQEGWDMHREYLKDRVVIFVETMKTGDYQFEVELEPRYTGRYHLNPVKAELMYFPVFFGRNEMKQLSLLK